MYLVTLSWHSLNRYRIYFQGIIRSNRAADLGGHPITWRLGRIGEAIRPALEGVRCLGVAFGVQFVSLVGDEQSEGGGGACRIAGGSALLLIVTGGVDQSALENKVKRNSKRWERFYA